MGAVVNTVVLLCLCFLVETGFTFPQLYGQNPQHDASPRDQKLAELIQKIPPEVLEKICKYGGGKNILCNARNLPEQSQEAEYVDAFAEDKAETAAQNQDIARFQNEDGLGRNDKERRDSVELSQEAQEDRMELSRQNQDVTTKFDDDVLDRSKELDLGELSQVPQFDEAEYQDAFIEDVEDGNNARIKRNAATDASDDTTTMEISTNPVPSENVNREENLDDTTEVSEKNEAKQSSEAKDTTNITSKNNTDSNVGTPAVSLGSSADSNVTKVENVANATNVTVNDKTVNASSNIDTKEVDNLATNSTDVKPNVANNTGVNDTDKTGNVNSDKPHIANTTAVKDNVNSDNETAKSSLPDTNNENQNITSPNNATANRYNGTVAARNSTSGNYNSTEPTIPVPIVSTSEINAPKDSNGTKARKGKRLHLNSTDIEGSDSVVNGTNSGVNVTPHGLNQTEFNVASGNSSANGTNQTVEVKGSTQKASKGTSILLILLVGVVVVGAALFGYKFVKKYRNKRASEDIETLQPMNTHNGTTSAEVQPLLFEKEPRNEINGSAVSKESRPEAEGAAHSSGLQNSQTQQATTSRKDNVDDDEEDEDKGQNEKSQHA